MSWVEILKLFAQYGLLGIYAGLATYGCVHLYRAKAKGETAHREDIKALHAAEQARADTLGAAHHEQMSEMQDRFMGYVTAVQSENRELTAQVRSLLEVVSRKRPR